MHDDLEPLRKQVLQVLKVCDDNSRGMTVAEIAKVIKADRDLVLVALYDLMPDIQVRPGSSLFPGETGQPKNPVESAAEQLLHYYRLDPNRQ